MTPRHTIGVIGAGPKATFCLEQLAKKLTETPPHQPVDVHVFEPANTPGAGAVYDPTQPHYLRLNYANRSVNMWADPSDGPTFTQWLSEHHPHHSDPDGSAPRALVGEYLHAGFTRILDRLRRHATVNLHRAAATSVYAVKDQWLIATDTDRNMVDEVVIAVGHDARQPTHSTDSAHYLSQVYPLNHNRFTAITPESSVAIRGFGLTAIDAILALTEGRGGTFVTDTSTGWYRYEPSGAEPERIYPYSRSGLAMTPKPADANDQHAPCLPHTITIENLRAFLNTAADRAPDDRPAAPVATGRSLRHAVDVSHGRAPIDREAATGIAWRIAYPEIVAAAQNGAFDTCWEAFDELCVEMERVAFGPPGTNAARLEALVDTGIVDLAAIRNPTVTPTATGFELGLDNRRIAVDFLINAVLPAQGIEPNPSPLFADLLAAGSLRLRNGGIDIAPDGYAIGSTGTRTAGLAVIGRATHGSTLGNDTLSRTLHDHPRQWAQACVTALREREPDATVTA